jgi:hypothetical protein
MQLRIRFCGMNAGMTWLKENIGTISKLEKQPGSAHIKQNYETYTNCIDIAY